jgi:hypothetical protein
MRELPERIRAYFGAGPLDRDFDREIEEHLTLLAEEYKRRGMSEAEAQRAARLHFGGASQLREATARRGDCRDSTASFKTAGMRCARCERVRVLQRSRC